MSLYNYFLRLNTIIKIQPIAKTKIISGTKNPSSPVTGIICGPGVGRVVGIVGRGVEVGVGVGVKVGVGLGVSVGVGDGVGDSLGVGEIAGVGETVGVAVGVGVGVAFSSGSGLSNV